MVVLPLVLLSAIISYGTHIRGGEITIRQSNGLVCEITVTGYTNLASPIRFGDGTLFFGDDTQTTLSTEPSEPTPTGVGIVRITVTHDYAQPGFYVVSYLEHNLDAGIQNFFSSVEIPLEISSGFNLDPQGHYSFLAFNTIPIFACRLRSAYAFSTAVVESDHRYRYEVVYPTGAGTYHIPASFSINPDNGLVTWDTKFNDTYFSAEYYFVVKIRQYDLNGHQLGYVTRAFQVITLETDSRLSLVNPVTDPDGKIVVPENQSQTIKLILEDSTATDSIYWDLDLDPAISGSVTLTQYDSVSGSRKAKIGWLTFTTAPALVRDLPYVISLRGTSQGYSKDVCFLYFTKDVPLPVITGLHEKPRQPIKAYPNPFSNLIFVSGLEDTGGNASITNLLGERVLQVQVAPGQAIETSFLPAGVYIVQVSDITGITQLKVKKNE
jgi:hypothetical protein